MIEYEFNCIECGEDHIFVGDNMSADAECADGTHSNVCPDEIFQSRAAEAAGDAMRDGS